MCLDLGTGRIHVQYLEHEASRILEGSGLDLQTRLRLRSPPLLLSDCAFIKRAESHTVQDPDLGPSRL